MNIELSYTARFVVALALGFLVGLERESSEKGKDRRLYAGIRTYTILSLFGFGCGWLFTNQVDLAVPLGMLVVAALLLVEYLDKLKHNRVGWTSEISALLVYVTGALTLLSDIWVPLALGLVNAFLLTEKSTLEKVVERLDKAEFLAVIKFLLITLIILPVLPNQEYTRYKLNPAHIWEIVILVSTIGFVGYFLSKRLGNRVGLWLSGLLGGIVSSTAVSVAVGRIAQSHPEHGKSALQASILASSVMYVRILIIIWLLAPIIALQLSWKMAVLAVIGLILAMTIRKQPQAVPVKEGLQSENPFEIIPALVFGGLYVGLTVLTEIVFQYLGNAGLTALSAVVGVTDIDPFVLSVVQRSLPQALVLSAVIIAMMSNTVTKGVYFGALAKDMRRETLLRYGLWALLHLPLLFLV